MAKRKTKKASAHWTGWHWLHKDRRLGYDDGREVVAGEWMTANAKPSMCNSGMHASARALDALGYAPGPIICRVELSDDVQTDGDKSVASKRRVLWMADATRTLREFAIWCAEEAIKAVEKLDGLTDGDRKALAAGKRCNEVHRAFLDGTAAEKELRAAESAAWSAARNAAGSAARSAAESAAWGAAWGAAWRAAWSAAESAAWSAALSAARDAQNAKLESMLMSLAPDEPRKERSDKR